MFIHLYIGICIYKYLYLDLKNQFSCDSYDSNDDRYVYMHMCINMYVYTYLHLYVRVYMYMHIYIYIYINRLRKSID
jgi:hypothetical protein